MCVERVNQCLHCSTRERGGWDLCPLMITYIAQQEMFRIYSEPDGTECQQYRARPIQRTVRTRYGSCPNAACVTRDITAKFYRRVEAEQQYGRGRIPADILERLEREEQQ